MATHRFHPTFFHNTLCVADPCLHVSDGDTIITDTVDASGSTPTKLPSHCGRTL